MAIWHAACHVSLTTSNGKEKEGMHRDNRGITLIEMIIAVAASAIVIGAATLFIRNALRSYKVAEDMIDLQVEAQVLMEQLATWVMEGNYCVAPENNDVLVIYNIPREVYSGAVTTYPGLAENRWMRVFWCDGSRNLYMYMPDVNGSPAKPDVERDSNVDGKEGTLLSDYVEEFEVEVINDSAGLPNKVAVTLSMKAGIQEYVLTDEINMRNAAYGDSAVSSGDAGDESSKEAEGL